ncbi:MAG: tetratricopeptide repeat protein [Bacteroidetes bacterium]|nr:tetratricopeptide repeat protein [Bacteroidota bacterium]
MQNFRSDTSAINAIIRVAKPLAGINNSLVFDASDSVINKSKRINYLNGIDRGLFLKALAYYYVGDMKNAIAQWKILDEYENSNTISIENRVRTLFIGGDIFAGIGDYSNSIDCLNKAESFLDSITDNSLKSGIYNSLSSFQLEVLKDAEKSIYYINKSIEYGKLANDNILITASYLNLGASYQLKKDYTQALNVYTTGLEWAEKKPNKISLKAQLLYSIGDIYFLHQKNYDKSIEHCQIAYSIYTKLGDKRGTIPILTLLAKNYIAKKSYKQAEIYLKKAEEESVNAHFLLTISQVYEGLKDLYLKTNDLPNAVKYFDLFYQINDSIASIEQVKKIKNLEAKAMEEKKQKEIELVLTENELNKLSAQNIKNERNLLIIGILFILALAGLLLNRYFFKQKATTLLEIKNKEIESQKNIIEEKNLKIIDSITYAKKIQESILPSKQTILQFFPLSTIYYKPKDVVSGDFYWFHHTNNLSFFAVADCTGHGVPGAFMSMVGTSLLTKIIVENKIYDTAEALHEMNKSVYEMLHQELGEEQSQDGMELALCCYNHATNQLSFSGAHLGILFITKNGITLFKPSEHPVGGLSQRGIPEPIRTYKKTKTFITEETTILLCTDGYIDQIGGLENKKYGISKLKEATSIFYRLPTETLEKIIDEEFISWKGSNLQIDDVLVWTINLKPNKLA